MTIYRVYGKEKGESRMKAFDFSNGVFVANLMYASFFYESELDMLNKEVENMNLKNPNYVFEVRKV